jgi:SAM-dependent methyltransferase
MMTIGPNTTADLCFQLTWHSRNVRHTDTYAGHMVNFWRDLLPRRLYDDLMAHQAGDRLEWRLAPEELASHGIASDVRRLKKAQFDPARFQAPAVSLCPGRFYPKGMLADVANIFTANREPFRCVEVGDDYFVADLGHPLAGKSLALNVTVGVASAKPDERGGGSRDWMEAITRGVGMQARRDDRPTDFFAGTPFARPDESPDDRFYAKPRLVRHIDDTAVEMARQLYERFLTPGTRVLDLMSSWDSHLPTQRAFQQVSGIGLNAAELEKNSALSDFKVHDLNKDPALPYATDHFDAVICTVSVEYLTNPWAVFAEAARVLRPGGHMIVTFSNRWFPPKAIALWPELHEFERMGLVLEYFHRTGVFADLQTYSVRGLKRPRHDKYFGEIPFSDPVYAVWGQKV